MNNLVIAFVVVLILIIFYYFSSKKATTPTQSPNDVSTSVNSATTAVQSMSNTLTTTLPTSSNNSTNALTINNNSPTNNNSTNALATVAAATTAVAAALTKTLPPVKPVSQGLDIISKMCKTCDSTCVPGKCEYACPNGTGIMSTLGYHLSSDPIYVVDYNNGNDSFQSGGNQYWFQGAYDSSKNSKCINKIGSIANCRICNKNVHCPYGTGVSSALGKYGPNDPVVIYGYGNQELATDDYFILNGYRLYVIDTAASASCTGETLQDFISKYSGYKCNFYGNANPDGTYQAKQLTQQIMDGVPNPLFYCETGFTGGYGDGNPVFLSTLKTDYSDKYYTADGRKFWVFNPITDSSINNTYSGLGITEYNQDLDNKIIAQCYMCGDNVSGKNTYVCPNGTATVSVNSKTGVKGNISSKMPVYLSDQQGTSEEQFAIQTHNSYWGHTYNLWYQGPFNSKTTCVKGAPLP